MRVRCTHLFFKRPCRISIWSLQFYMRALGALDYSINKMLVLLSPRTYRFRFQFAVIHWKIEQNKIHFFFIFLLFFFAEYRSSCLRKKLLSSFANKSGHSEYKQSTDCQNDGQGIYVWIREPIDHARQSIFARLDLLWQSWPDRSSKWIWWIKYLPKTHTYNE